MESDFGERVSVLGGEMSMGSDLGNRVVVLGQRVDMGSSACMRGIFTMKPNYLMHVT